ncbi:glycosyltransferase family 2 protein [bacterium]|nr:glycosyltransferase family 2 protein [bacterium]
MSDKKDIKISIVIPNYNGAELLEKCIESVYLSDIDFFEVIVIDNGSSDESVDLIEKKYPDVKIEKFKKNTGFAVACNAGIKKSDGEFIFLLNNDVELEKSCISTLYDVLRTQSVVAMVCPKMLMDSKRSYIDAAGDALTIGGAAYNRGHNLKDEGQYGKEEIVFGVCAGAALYRKKIFDKIGLFDEDYFAYMEDVDFNLRANLSGYKCKYIPDAVCYHKGNATFGFFSPKHIFYTNRNTVFFILKYYRLSWILEHLTVIINHQIKMARLCSGTGRGWSFLKSRLGAIIKLPKMIIKRHFFLMKFFPDWQRTYNLLDK